ncbi:MAG TPA: hypothetical protein VEA99_06050 [Gemmatimonadaceae bacterium]|nr:hypothetical protein [Gemmatimonadaceae bacterium]
MERSESERREEQTSLRAEERASVRLDIEARLRARGVALNGDENDDQLASMSEAVEQFEDAVIAIGGDRMVDSADSSEPEHPDLVLPPRGDDESGDAYVRRLRDLTGRIASRRGSTGT